MREYLDNIPVSVRVDSFFFLSSSCVTLFTPAEYLPLRFSFYNVNIVLCIWAQLEIGICSDMGHCFFSSVILSFVQAMEVSVVIINTVAYFLLYPAFLVEFSFLALLPMFFYVFISHQGPGLFMLLFYEHMKIVQNTTGCH